MLGLTLREEFRGKRLKGTAIELSNDTNTGATQVAAKLFLEITYPTHDLLKGIEAVGPNKGQPIAVIGERGLGKSHLMAALYHAVNDPVSTAAWLKSWATTLGDPSIGKIALRSEMLVIGESNPFTNSIITNEKLSNFIGPCKKKKLDNKKTITRLEITR